MDAPPAVFPVTAANARIRFSVRWFGVIMVRGTFGVIRGTLERRSNGDPPNVSVTVDSQSVRTGIALRDRHLRGLRFLDSGQHPVITFVSDRVTRDNGVWDVTGRLRLRGLDRPVSLAVRDRASSPAVRHLTTVFAVPRRPHAIGTASGIRRLNPLLWAIGDEVAVEVELDVPATMLAPEHAPVR